MSKTILGGGLSGLSAAFYLTKKGPKESIQLLEQSGRLGGWVKSNNVQENIIFEEGPRTLRPRGEPGANTLSLIEELDLSHEIVPISSSHPAARNRMIYVDGALHSLPNSISSLLKTTPPFKKPLFLYLANDLFAKSKKVKDESIYDFFNRRFGQELADYLISPLICGICAGNAKEISVNFLMKTLFEYEQQHGSISKGLLKSMFKNTKSNVEEGQLSKRVSNEKWNVYSFKNGLETLPKQLEKYIRNKNVDIKMETYCKELEIDNSRINMVLSNGDERETKHVISAIPSFQLASLLQIQHPQLSKLLNKIQYVTVGVVNLHYNGKLIDKPGFGFLVPPKEKLPILGVIYDSCCFPKSDSTVLTVMMGGHWYKQYFANSSEEELLITAKQQLKNILGINQEPIQYKINVLKNCIPQYVVGHNENLRQINEYILSKKLPISICGVSYHGVGVNDVILSAKKAVENI